METKCVYLYQYKTLWAYAMYVPSCRDRVSGDTKNRRGKRRNIGLARTKEAVSYKKVEVNLLSIYYN